MGFMCKNNQTIRLTFPPAILNPNNTKGWRAKAAAKASYKNTCHIECKLQGISPMQGPIHARIVFYPPDRRKRDLDNMLAAFKSGIDGVSAAIGVDDSEWEITIVKAKHTGGYVAVELTEIHGTIDVPLMGTIGEKT